VDVDDRPEYLREHLAALQSYGNGDGQRAAAARAEIAEIEQELAGIPVDEQPTARPRRTRKADQ
jgi:hypothetical protein